MAAITHVGSIKKHFAKLRDPRVRGRTQHRLIDIIVMAICAAIRQLLALLDLKGALVTIDAMGCQKEIARHIVAAGADYVLTVKANQEQLLEDIQTTVEKALDGELPAQVVEEYTTTERGHGRQEQRSYLVIHD